MEKVPLRDYNREIEKLIDQGQFEEAVAHCRFILQKYPKHLETYRLLGKIYLESEHFGEATDIFLRVISSVPDDFVSNIGLSIIREDEGNMDAAIWHMERAYETQPSNTAVQGELRRLYGRRDGLEPTRIRLSRGALARMYLRGNLYQQAIAETRAAMLEEPQRPDLQIILAKLYNLTGRRVEATELCSTLLSKYPYCYEANRILAEILPSTKRAEDAQIYRLHVNSLDPYHAFTTTEVQDPIDVPDNAVQIEHLDWKSISASTELPQWASSLGISILGQDKAEEAVPDWFKETAIANNITQEQSLPAPIKEESVTTSPSEPDIIETIQELDQSKIPDWMAEAGWVEAASHDENPAAVTEESPSEAEEALAEIQPGEIPDWLKELAPIEVTEAEIIPGESSSLEHVTQPDKTTPGESSKIEEQIDLQAPVEVETTLETQKIISSIEEYPSEPEQTLSVAEDLPTALKEDLPEINLAGVEAFQPDDISLHAEEPQGLSSEETALQPIELVSEESQTKPPISEVLIPQPLKPYFEDSKIQAPISDETINQPIEQVSEDAQADTTISEEESRELTSISTEDVVQHESSLVPEGIKATQPEESELIEIQPSEETAQATGKTKLEQDEAFAWLENLAAKQGAEAETLFVNPENRTEAPPAWVQEFESGSEKPTPLADTQPLHPIATMPEIQSPTTQPEQEQPVPLTTSESESPDATFAWLESLAAKHGAEEETLLFKPDERIETPPSWIQEATQLIADNEQVPTIEKEPGLQEPIGPSSQSLIPDWLKEAEVVSQETISVHTAPEDVEHISEDSSQINVSASQVNLEQPSEVMDKFTVVPIKDSNQTESSTLEWLASLEKQPSTDADNIPTQTLGELEVGQEMPEQLVTEIPTEQVGSMHSPEEIGVSETDMANWLQDLDKDETGQIAQVPAIETTSTDITWLHELDEASKKVPESDAVIAVPALSSEPSLIVEQPSISKPEVTSPIGEVNTRPAVTELQNAQADLLEGRVPQAIEKYNALIANGQFVDEIIHDLRDALYKYPVEILIWQALGDAYVRTNRLQDALDAYTQAEELIR